MSENEMNSEQPIVSLKDVHKSFGDFEVLKGISFDVKKGEVICIIGPSGSGKSTLIRCINRLETHDRGAISIDGVALDDGAAAPMVTVPEEGSGSVGSPRSRGQARSAWR